MDLKVTSDQGAKEFWSKALKDKETAKYLLNNLPEKIISPWKFDGRCNIYTGENIVWYSLITRSYSIKKPDMWRDKQVYTLPSDLDCPSDIENFLDQKLQELGYTLL